jgi:hypothetical protein
LSQALLCEKFAKAEKITDALNIRSDSRMSIRELTTKFFQKMAASTGVVKPVEVETVVTGHYLKA